MAAAEVELKSPSVPLFQRGILFRGLLTPLEKGKGRFWTEYSGSYAANFWVRILELSFYFADTLRETMVARCAKTSRDAVREPRFRSRDRSFHSERGASLEERRHRSVQSQCRLWCLALGRQLFKRPLKHWSLQAAINQRHIAFAPEGSSLDRCVTLNCVIWGATKYGTFLAAC